MNENALIESRTLRDEMIGCDFVLDKVKKLEYLGDDVIATVKMVANYYEVPNGTIKSLISEHNEELTNDGLKVLKGNELKDFKARLEYPTNLQKDSLQEAGDLSEGLPQNEGNLKFAPSFTIIPRRALLRIGMLLRDSEVAKEVRDYLLDVERLARLAGIVARKDFTAAIQEKYPESRWKYKNFTDLVYKVTFGRNAKQLKEDMSLAKSANIRDHIKVKDLKKIEKIEAEMMTLLDYGFDYQQIKAMVIDKYIAN